MHLIGIGFTPDYWENLVHCIRNLSPAETLVGTLLVTDAVESEQVEMLGDQVADARPDLVIFNLHALENAKDWQNFLTCTQANCENRMRWVLVVEDEREELSMLVRLGPEVELVNGMRFPVNDPGILLNHHIRSFPRIRLTSRVQALEFRNRDAGTLRRRLSELQPNTLIPISDLRHVETAEGDLQPREWLEDFLASRPKPLHPDQVKGILREPKGCYLFPGVSFNSIRRIHFNGARIDNVLRSGRFKLNNIPFKRMIEEVREDWLETKRVTEATAKKRQRIPICCLGEVPVINSMLRILLSELGYRKFSETTKLESGIHELDQSIVWFQISEFTGSVLRGKLLDWSGDIRKFMKPLRRFVDLKQLEIAGAITSSPLMQKELEQQSLELLHREKTSKNECSLARNRLLIYSQELKVLDRARKVANILLPALENCLEWADAHESPEDLQGNCALLICDEESAAAYLTREMKNIQRKWWVSPFHFKQPENLMRINAGQLQRYTTEGITVATESSLKQLRQLCNSAKEQVKGTRQILKQQEQVIEIAQQEVERINRRKTQLALHWLYVSLKQLLIRDLHRIPAGTM